jgi:DNA primase
MNTFKQYRHFLPAREHIIARLNLVQFYQGELPDMPKTQRQAGWLPGGPCPFHDDKHPGSFRINAEHGGFKCHACGAQGDIISFVMDRDRVNFKTALSWLEGRAA